MRKKIEYDYDKMHRWLDKSPSKVEIVEELEGHYGGEVWVIHVDVLEKENDDDF